MEKEKKEKKEKKKTNRHEVTVKIDGDIWEKALDESFKEKQKTVSVPGFRKGKVSRDVFEKKYGKESLYLDAADSVAQIAFAKALKDSELTPIVYPKTNLKSIDESGVEFEFIIITKPEVKIKKYKGLKIEKEEVKVTKEEINKELDRLLDQFSELKSVDRKAKVGDFAIIDYKGLKDGVEFDGGSADAYQLELGSNSFIPGFEDQIVGMKKGEDKDLELSFPDEYPEPSLAGQPVVFKVHVVDIKEKVKPEFNKDFFADLGIEGVDSKDKLEKEIEKSIKMQKDTQAENVYVDKLLDAVAKEVEVDIPDELVEDEVDRLKHNFEHQLSHQGLNLELYYQFTNSDEQALLDQLNPEAYQNILYRFMLDEIKVKENITIDEKELDKEIEKLCKEYDMKEEDFMKQFNNDKELVKYNIEMQKTLDKLKELNK